MQTCITYTPTTITAELQAFMSAVAETDKMVQLTVHVKNAKGDACVREALRLLTPQRVELGLDMALNSRVYHNDTKVLEVVLEDYVVRNGWRRDYVDVRSWQTEELRFAGLNAS